MLRLLRRALAFFQRRADPAQEQHSQQAELQQAITHLKHIQGVVTHLYGNYGFIDRWIYFTFDVVTENTALSIGQKVRAVLEEDKTAQELKAIKVDVVSDINDSEPSYFETKVITACVTSVNADTVYADEQMYFSLDIVSKDFMPYKGDWVEIEYSSLPGPCNIKLHSAKPLFHKHLEGVCITSLRGRNGVVDNTIFFTLDSLKLPDGYSPHRYDIVSVVIVGSIQSCYVWRAISMTPLPK
ncbi:cancer/testis antigen 55-like [Tupaia chinensis]|uniref:cancer/testis antigen 55-like n=1 Tax=Tupaia chinensis TaxID=246437 RepID=UPI0003C9006A|nr:cancer/testis antigen 55-like [Tupaia chinensis]